VARNILMPAVDKTQVRVSSTEVAKLSLGQLQALPRMVGILLVKPMETFTLMNE